MLLKSDKRFQIINYIWIMVFLGVTFFLFTPLVLFITNKGEFWFEAKDFIPTLAVICAVFVIILVSLLVMIPVKWAEFISVLLFTLGIAFYIQGQILPNDYGILDGTAIDWENYGKEAVISAIVWLGVIGIGIILYFKLGDTLIKITKYIAVIMLSVELVMLLLLGFTIKNENDTSKEFLSTKGMYQISDTNNVIVLLLDAFDAEVFEELMAENDQFLNELKGFSYYRDTVGGATRTRYAIPYILYGRAYKDPVSYTDYKRIAYENSSFMACLSKYNIDYACYTNPSYIDKTHTDIIKNISGAKMRPSSYLGLSKDMIKLAAFREFPHFLKKYVWSYSGEFDKWKSSSDDPPYRADDVKFYETLVEIGLGFNGSKNVFRFYHLDGDHAPYTMNENAVRVSEDESSELKQARGCFTIVAEYLKQLRKLGVYDKSTIIIMSDHGCARGIEQNPLFMIKPAGQNGNFVSSKYPLSYSNLQEIFCAAIESSTEYPESYIERNKERYFYTGVGIVGVKEWIIDGLAYDVTSIYDTGNIYEGNSIETSEEYKQYMLGTELSFEENATGNMYCNYGISTPEMTHTWLEDKYTIFRFKIDGKYKNISVNINANVYNEQQNIALYANGKKVGELCAQGSNPIEVIIPGKYVINNELEFVIYHPDAISPFEKGESGDKRKLSLYMHNMCMTSTDEAFNADKYTGTLSNTPSYDEIKNLLDYTNE